MRAGERRAAWFSVRADWEPTAPKHTLTFKEWPGFEAAMRRDHEAFGLVRIGVKPSVAPVSWRDYLRKGGPPKRVAAALAEDARRRGGTPANWFVRFGDVPAEMWQAVEVWEPGSGDDWLAGGSWVPLTDTKGGDDGTA